MTILCICLSSTIQRTLSFEKLTTGAVNRSQSFIENVSGKGLNTARVLNQLEKNCARVLCTAGKLNKERFFKLAKADNLSIIPVLTEGNTRECWTLLSKDGTTTEIVADEVNKSGSAPEKKFFSLLNKALKKCDGVIFSGSCPKIWNQDIVQKICRTVKDNQLPLLADFWGINLLNTLNVCTPDIIKINEDEFLNTFGVSASKENLCEKSKELNCALIVTRGKASTLAGFKGDFFECQTHHITPINTTACGDSFNAGFMYEFLKSGNIDKSLNLGTDCAAKNGESLIPGSLI